ncbi:MAG: hypothetical protein PHE58_06675 [Candidatus Omnitrophica bacterium]|nr:hypothetical protein [Candidatus Omnitrophota bacterium]
MDRTKWFVFGFFLLFAFPCAAPAAYSGMMENRDFNFDFVPGPRLEYPVTNDIDLNGKESLEFRWSRARVTETRYYLLKIYTGYKTTASFLIFERQFLPPEYPVQIPASLFTVGQVYTWTLTQVFTGGEKSDTSSSPFTIKKK